MNEEEKWRRANEKNVDGLNDNDRREVIETEVKRARPDGDFLRRNMKDVIANNVDGVPAKEVLRKKSDDNEELAALVDDIDIADGIRHPAAQPCPENHKSAKASCSHYQDRGPRCGYCGMRKRV